MNTNKPASAPPAADTLLALMKKCRERQERLLDLNDDDCAEVMGDCIAELDEALAASAQVREVEPSALAWMQRTAESLGVASRADGLLAVAGALTGWIDMQRRKPAAKPAPVAQGVVNHAEASQLAHMKRDESNLARCYLDLEASLAACRAVLLHIRNHTSVTSEQMFSIDEVLRQEAT